MQPTFKLLICLTLNCINHQLIAKQPFSSYNVRIYNGKKAKLIIKGNPLAEMYKTTIRATYYSSPFMKKWHGKTGLNFAGHYCFVWWGCGSPCQNSAVVDLKTGIVYPGTDASIGFKFQPNSRLLIVNPSVTKDDCAFCKIGYWLWNEHYHKFEKLKNLNE